MPIVSSIIRQDHAQADGRRRIVEQHTDHLGNEYSASYLGEASIDAAAVMAGRVAGIETRLVDKEENRFVSEVLEGRDLINIVASHSTKNKIWKRLLLEYRKRDARFGIKLLPLLQHINANFTDTQIKNFLDITQTKLNAIRARAVSLASLKTDLETDDALIRGD
jgi:hypothetical protein